jgi:hypothetical protein
MTVWNLGSLLPIRPRLMSVGERFFWYVIRALKGGRSQGRYQKTRSIG